MPIPENSFDFEFRAHLTIDENGVVSKIKNAMSAGEPVDDDFARRILDGLVISAAQNNNKDVSDEIDLKITYTLVQKSDIQHIKEAWLNSLKNNQEG